MENKDFRYFNFNQVVNIKGIVMHIEYIGLVSSEIVKLWMDEPKFRYEYDGIQYQQNEIILINDDKMLECAKVLFNNEQHEFFDDFTKQYNEFLNPLSD